MKQQGNIIQYFITEKNVLFLETSNEPTLRKRYIFLSFNYSHLNVVVVVAVMF